jgi:hypothetical protein
MSSRVTNVFDQLEMYGSSDEEEHNNTDKDNDDGKYTGGNMYSDKSEGCYHMELVDKENVKEMVGKHFQFFLLVVSTTVTTTLRRSRIWRRRNRIHCRMRLTSRCSTTISRKASQASLRRRKRQRL